MFAPTLDYRALKSQGDMDALRKALDSTTTTTGNVLIPSMWDKAIPELALATAPLAGGIVPDTPWDSGTYIQDVRSAFGRARFVADGNSSVDVNSTYAQRSFSLKMLQVKGGVTGFEQWASKAWVDSLQSEVFGHTTSWAYEKEWALLYGNEDADSTMPRGLEYFSQNANSMNIVDAGGAISFSLLDQAIDAIRAKGVVPSPQNAAFVMSFKMQSKLAQLAQSTGFNFFRQTDMVEARGGFRFVSYNNIPIVTTSFIQGDQTAMGTATPTLQDSVGYTALANSVTYKYYVSAVTQFGETLPSAEASQATGTSGTANQHTITLTWTAYAGARLYKIYRTSSSTGTEVHYTTIPANIYTTDAAGFGFVTATPVTSWVDTGSRTSQTLSGAVVTGANYTPSVASSTLDELQAHEEDVYLITTSVPSVAGYTLHAPTLKPVQYYPLAPIADKTQFLVVGYYANVCVEPYQVRIPRATFA